MNNNNTNLIKEQNIPFAVETTESMKLYKNLLTQNFHFELGALWFCILSLLVAYILLYAWPIPYGSITHGKVIYGIFVIFNTAAAVIATYAWHHIPLKSVAKDAMLFFCMCLNCSAAGNLFDYIFWFAGLADFKQSFAPNILFILALLFALTGVHILAKLCTTQVSKKPMLYYLTVVCFYVAIPFMMNPGVLKGFSTLSNPKELLFGLIYSAALGYLAAVSLQIWQSATGRLTSAARLICLSLFFLSLGSAIYAGLFPITPLDEIPSNPLHVLIALGYLCGGLGVRRTEKTINTLFNLKNNELPPSLALVELFGKNRGLEVYRILEENIRRTHKELFLTKSDNEEKAQLIAKLETEISLREQAEQNLIKEKEKAEEANKTKSHFLAMMSHELKTPLTAIKGYSSLISKSDYATASLTQDQISELAGHICINSDHLKNMIESILRFSQLEEGTFTYIKEEFSLSEILPYIERLIEEKTHSSSVTFSSFISNRELRLYTDKLALQQILVNLLTNAFKFCKNEAITMTIDSQGKTLHLRVEDKGIGIAKEHLDKVFDAFFQVSHGNRRKFGGTGLGLSIIKKVIDELSGEIFIESKKNIGSTFDVYLPETIVKD